MMLTVARSYILAENKGTKLSVILLIRSVATFLLFSQICWLTMFPHYDKSKHIPDNPYKVGALQCQHHVVCARHICNLCCRYMFILFTSSEKRVRSNLNHLKYSCCQWNETVWTKWTHDASQKTKPWNKMFLSRDFRAWDKSQSLLQQIWNKSDKILNLNIRLSQFCTLSSQKSVLEKQTKEQTLYKFLFHLYRESIVCHLHQMTQKDNHDWCVLPRSTSTQPPE